MPRVFIFLLLILGLIYGVFKFFVYIIDSFLLLDERFVSNVKEVDKTVDDFIKDNEIKTFFTKNIENMLSNYESGLPKYKPDVLIQMLDIEEKKYLHLLNNGSNSSINMKDSFGNVTRLNQLQVIQTIHELQDMNLKLLSMLNEKTDIIKKLHYRLHKSLPKRDLQDLLLEINQLN